MFNISSFLDKLSKNVRSAESEKEKILELIFKNTQINIPLEDLEIKDFIVYIKSSPAVKNKIFIFKQKILNDLSNSISSKIVDIR